MLRIDPRSDGEVRGLGGEGTCQPSWGFVFNSQNLQG